MKIDVTSLPWFNKDVFRLLTLMTKYTPYGLGTIVDKGKLVGGCVRDAILNKTPKDIDIATSLHPDKVIDILKTTNIEYVKTGIEHGTVTAILNHVPYEITTLRRDVSTDGRRAVVSFTDDWSEDSLRRDFTINAMYMDIDGNIYDFHDGLIDIKEKRLKFVGDPTQRIKEDYLRILRYFRFAAQLGFHGTKEGLDACELLNDGLKKISGERIQAEMWKIFSSKDPLSALYDMHYRINWKNIGFPTIRPEWLADYLEWEKELELEIDPVRRILTAGCLDNNDVYEMNERLKLPSHIHKRLLDASMKSDDVSIVWMKESALKEYLYRHGKEFVLDIFVCEMSPCCVDHDKLPHVFKRYEFIKNFVIPKLPIGGKNIVAAGIKPSPLVGIIQRNVEAWWIKNDFPSDEKTIEYFHYLIGTKK